MSLDEVLTGFNMDREWQDRVARISFLETYKNKKLVLNKYDSQLGWDYELDSQRIRGDKNYLKEKTPGKIRILTLGDSYTYGNEVGDKESYPYFLEQLLPNVEVINMGVGGYGIDQAFLKYQYFGKQYSPDLVLVGLYIGMFNRANVDFTHYLKPAFYYDEKSQSMVMKNRSIPPPETVLAKIKKSYTWVSYAGLMVQRFQKLISQTLLEEKLKYYVRMDKIVQHIFSKLKKDVNAQGAELAVVQIPQAERFSTNPSQTIGEAHFLKTIRQLGIPVIDIEKEFETLGKSIALADYYVHRPNGSLGHFSPKGNHAVAKSIASYLCNTYEPIKNNNPALDCSF